MLADDCSLTPDQTREVRAAARRVLEDGGAIGVFPTPVDQILDAARVEVVSLVIDEGYLARLRRKAEAAGQALLSAISKVWGVFDPHARVAFIDPETPKDKLPFLKLHEGGHAVLPWQSVFGMFEDCRKTLDPEVKSGFEREANVFASEVLFQLDVFSEEARSLEFGIKAPLGLARRYGASVYSTIRRYVICSDRICAVLVFNPAEFRPGTGQVSTLRRAAASPAFLHRFPDHVWPVEVTAGSGLGAVLPFGRMSAPRPLVLTDADGNRHPFVAEAFRTPYQTFVLLHAEATLGQRTITSARLMLV